MLRNTGYKIIELIYYIRFFGAGTGLRIWFSLLLHRSREVCLRIPFFKNPVYIRRKDSDPAIFFQIFGELQYQWCDIGNADPAIIVDAGSNVGFSALFFAHRFPKAHIYCIEPDPDNYQQLQKNTRNYERIHTHLAALWPADDRLDIPNKHGESASIRVEKNENSLVQGMSLPTLIERYGLERIDILKIDIEGAEKELFSTQPLQWLDKVDIIIIELHDMYRAGTAQAFFNAIHDRFEKIYIQGENIICYLKH